MITTRQKLVRRTITKNNISHSYSVESYFNHIITITVNLIFYDSRCEKNLIKLFNTSLIHRVSRECGAVRYKVEVFYPDDKSTI